MKTIWKYPLQITDKQTINIPFSHEILTIQVQYSIPTLWILVDTETPLINVEIECYGTGHQVKSSINRQYIGTIQLEKGILIYHFFRTT